jgi:hypothetical protein
MTNIINIIKLINTKIDPENGRKFNKIITSKSKIIKIKPIKKN